MKILITGGAGFIGFHLAEHLSKQDYDVTILDNFSRSEEDEDLSALIARPNVTFIKGDITKKDTFEELGSFDYVYHLAAINGTKNFYERPHQVLQVGATGTLNVLEWFSKREKGKLLFSSSSETYAGSLEILGKDFPIPTPEDVPLIVTEPSNVRWSYGASKILGEVAMHSYGKVHGIDYCIIRYHNIYGPRMGFDHVVPQFIQRILDGDDPFTVYGNATRTFCYVKDAVEATQKVMESDTRGATIHIGRSDDEIEIVELARKLFDIAGVTREIAIKEAPKGSVNRRCPDVSKLKSLGFEATTSLDEGLRESLEWYKRMIE